MSKSACVEIIRSNVPEIVVLWQLRMLVGQGAHRELLSRHGFSCETVVRTIGLGHWLDTNKDYDINTALSELRALACKSEKQLAGALAPDTLANNLAALQQLIGLSEVDCRVLEFVALLRTEETLDRVSDWLGICTTLKVARILSRVLDLPLMEIRASLAYSGMLVRSGLLTIGEYGSTVLSNKLSMLSDRFADRLVSELADPVDLLGSVVHKSTPPQLTFAAYRHIEAPLGPLRAFMRHAVSHARKGVNVLLHGVPGTGKTQLSRLLAAENGCEILEVASESDDDVLMDGPSRLRAFRAAQCFFAHRAAIVIFDEVEDVFNDANRLLGGRSTAQTHKGWINRLLEENPVPAIWLSNSVAGLDPAFIRRFDLVVEVPIPPKRQREAIIAQVCGSLLDAKVAQRFSESENLAPAVVARAASVVRSIRGEPNCDPAGTFEILVNGTLAAQRHAKITVEDANRLPDLYDPSLIQADTDLRLLADRLARGKAGRLCLYGPPGTGKTAYARWVAEQVQMPLLIKRASDLLSPWVGMNEKNMANAFRAAEQDDAILLIDEVDSFLQDRQRAQHSWEISAVNEMLTRMESFNGIFIASTNLMRDLDRAAMRRFDLKIAFDYLRPAQSIQLLARYCAQLKLPTPSDRELARLGSLALLTPGDFAMVMRQHRLRPIASVSGFCGALEEECELKEAGRSRGIGFLR